MFTLTLQAQTIDELRDLTIRSLEQMGTPTIPVQMELPTRPESVMETVVTKPIAEVEAHVPVVRTPAPVPVPTESSIDGVSVSDLDKDGRVWDERIDNPLKSKNQYGKWKAKIGVNKTDRIRIIEELKHNIKPESQPAPAQPQEIETQETNQVETLADLPPAEHMTLEHFTNNFPTVMGNLFNEKKITSEKVQQLCEIARVKQAYEIINNETSTKAVYNTLVMENLI